MHNNVIMALDSSLSDLGISIIRFDFRGPNSSSGEYTGPKGAIKDALSVIKYLTERKGISELGLIGYSFGGSVALGVCTIFNPSFLITLSASVELLKDAGISLEALSNVTCPSLLIHAKNDRMVPFSDIEKISSCIGGLNESFVIESDGHFYSETLKQATGKVTHYVARYLGLDLPYN